MLAVALVVFAQAAGPSSWGGWTSGRPPECGDSTGGRGANIWERAKTPALKRYCDLVAGASSKLAGSGAMAQAALETSRQAEQLLPGHAAPRVLEGRALAALGKLDEARAALTDARTREAAAFDDPTALLAWARVSARTGHIEEASEAYRTLLPRASALAGGDRGNACIEAGLVESVVRGKDGIDEATAALREAVRETRDDALGVAVLGLALALDRRGDPDEARALLAEHAHGDPRTLFAQRDAKDLLAVAPGEEAALVAIGTESTDASVAREAWSRYISASPNGSWAAHAGTHLAALGPGRKPAQPANRAAAGAPPGGRR
jgi:tetratricopeptide (TPR) repeat protein